MCSTERDEYRPDCARLSLHYNRTTPPQTPSPPPFLRPFRSRRILEHTYDALFLYSTRAVSPTTASQDICLSTPPFFFLSQLLLNGIDFFNTLFCNVIHWTIHWQLHLLSLFTKGNFPIFSSFCYFLHSFCSHTPIESQFLITLLTLLCFCSGATAPCPPDISYFRSVSLTRRGPWLRVHWDP